MRPKTVHGCRPISVKIQPRVLARKGRPIPAMASRYAHRPAGSLPRLVSQSPAAASSADSAPKPIIRRNDQYARPTTGR